jgi:hypothetical protein
MNRKYLIAIVVFVLIGAVIVSYIFWRHNQAQPIIAENVEVQPSPPVPTPKPVQTPIPIVVILSFPQLPQLTKSDSFVFDSLSGLLSNQSLIKIFHTKRIIHKIVTTIINLPEQRAPSNQ